ncbi:MAG: SDR family oxidoreductase [Hyphomicrobium sp.]|nr:SDR family oxidoreductase [Hyphomicrobium sp.]
MDLGLKGKNAVVTGGSRGLGAAIAEVLASEGMNVVLVARDKQALEENAASLRARHGTRAVPLAADLTSIPEIERAAAAAVAALGTVDLLVNSAGATKRGDFFALTDADWESGFGLKFFGAMRMSRALWPSLKQSRGAIVNIVGVGARMPSADFTIGGSVNAAFLHFTKALSTIGTRDGVRVNAINPGVFETGRLQQSLRSAAEQAGVPIAQAADVLLSKMGVPRFGKPEEVARLVAYLASEHAAYMNGAAIEIDGGSQRNI